MSESTNRLVCKCGKFASHQVSTLFNGTLRELHLCEEHFAFLCRIHPLNLKDEKGPELQISAADFDRLFDDLSRNRPPETGVD